MRELPTSPKEFLRRARGTYVVVDLDVNRLRLMQDTVTLWEAPVGTGTGLRLKGDDGEWHFTTPRGVFQIQYKEELPVWVLPDWYYVEKKLPIPPPNAPENAKAPAPATMVGLSTALTTSAPLAKTPLSAALWLLVM